MPDQLEKGSWPHLVDVPGGDEVHGEVQDLAADIKRWRRQGTHDVHKNFG